MATALLIESTLKELAEKGAAESALCGPSYIWDTKTKGLGVRLNGDHTLVWVIKLKISRKTHTRTIGPWPAVKAKEAREQVELLRSRIRSGVLQTHRPPEVAMWADVVKRFESTHLPRLKPKTQDSYRSVINCHLRPAFKGKLVHEITEEEVQAFYCDMERIPRQANVCLMVLNIIFERCEAWRYRPINSNPVSLLRKAGYKRYPEKVRTRLISDDELERLGRALEELEREGYAQFAAAVRVMLFTGARLSEVLSMEWGRIDVSRKEIVWPDSKTGQMSKPLNDALFEVLAGLPREESSPWVFPSPKSATGHLEDIKRPWKLLLARAGITNLHRHDLRHNIGNRASDAGYSLPVIATLLGHSQTATTERYVQPADATRLDASNLVSGRVKQVLLGKRTEASDGRPGVQGEIAPMPLVKNG